MADTGISFCYILFFWRTGSLPWLHTKDRNEEMVQKRSFGEGLSSEDSTPILGAFPFSH